jgi:hypothetical protein
MYLYEGVVVRTGNNKFHAVILRLDHNEPNCDTIMERECNSEEEANIWVDDEMMRLTEGKGVWDV